jgi:hypothetical protein
MEDHNKPPSLHTVNFSSLFHAQTVNATGELFNMILDTGSFSPGVAVLLTLSAVRCLPSVASQPVGIKEHVG